MDALERKARRRIKRMLATAKYQHRCHPADDTHIVYVVRHGNAELNLRFHVTKTNRLYLMNKKEKPNVIASEEVTSKEV